MQSEDQLAQRAHRNEVARHRLNALGALNQAHRALGQLIDAIENLNPNIPLSRQKTIPWGIGGVVHDVGEAQARLAALDAIRELEHLMPAIIPRQETTE